jgi:cytochrome c oxidase assembly factor CtaG
MIPYLLFADIQNTALSAFLIFSERVLYPTYAAVPRLWGITVLDDQAAAGAIMWVPGSVIFLVPVAMIAIRLLDPARTRSTRGKKNFNQDHEVIHDLTLAHRE